MVSLKNIFFLLLSLSIILCQEKNKTEQKKEEVETPADKTEPPKEEAIKETNTTTNETSHTHRKPPKKSKNPFNMTMNEMDTMMFCTLVVQDKVKTDKTKLESLQKRLNISDINRVYEKIGTDIFENCFKNIDINIVNIYMKNLTYANNFKWRKEFNEISNIDYDKYNNLSDLFLSMDQQVLMYKFQGVNEKYRQKKADERDDIDEENRKIKIGQIDMESIPTSIKLVVFLVILILLFGGVFYLLKTLEKKPKEKKKKEKKKKTQ